MIKPEMVFTVNITRKIFISLVQVKSSVLRFYFYLLSTYDIKDITKIERKIKRLNPHKEKYSEKFKRKSREMSMQRKIFTKIQRKIRRNVHTKRKIRRNIYANKNIQENPKESQEKFLHKKYLNVQKLQDGNNLDKKKLPDKHFFFLLIRWENFMVIIIKTIINRNLSDSLSYSDQPVEWKKILLFCRCLQKWILGTKEMLWGERVGLVKLNIIECPFSKMFKCLKDLKWYEKYNSIFKKFDANCKVNKTRSLK